jgi:hypothetical protein
MANTRVFYDFSSPFYKIDIDLGFKIWRTSRGAWCCTDVMSFHCSVGYFHVEGHCQNAL